MSTRARYAASLVVGVRRPRWRPSSDRTERGGGRGAHRDLPGVCRGCRHRMRRPEPSRRSPRRSGFCHRLVRTPRVRVMARYFDVHPVDPQPPRDHPGRRRRPQRRPHRLPDGLLLRARLRAGQPRGRSSASGRSATSTSGTTSPWSATTSPSSASSCTCRNAVFRLVKASTPGSYTFILPATKEVPRQLMHPKKKTVGVRIPDHVVAQALLAELGEPLLSSTLLLPDDDEPMTQGWEIKEGLDHVGRRGDRLRGVRHRAHDRDRLVRRRAGDHPQGRGGRRALRVTPAGCRTVRRPWRQRTVE